MRVFTSVILFATLGAAVSIAGASADNPAPIAATEQPVTYDEQAPLTLDEKVSAGRRKFNEPWSLRNDLDGVWGLGPTFNETSCPACHRNASRAAAPAHGQEAKQGMVIRLSVPGRNPQGGPLAHPHYGDQLQNRAIANRVPREGRALIFYDAVAARFADGSNVLLRKPRIEFSELAFGELDTGTMVSARVAPALFGLGLLEAVPESAIVELAKQQPAHGISGRINYVWDEETRTTVLGRFGWKANQPSLRQQVAAALLNDIGATSSIFPVDNCPAVQTVCRTEPTTTDCGGGASGCSGNLLPEVLPSRLETITTYLQALPVPAREATKDYGLGARLFEQAKCATCHTPELKTGANTALPSNANTTIHPYSDLLLHDMGEELSDGRPDFLADGREWRTPPLWGIGQLRALSGHSDLMHDGRARDVTEAILWHGGEAEAAREAFKRMSKSEREALIRFVESL